MFRLSIIVIVLLLSLQSVNATATVYEWGNVTAELNFEERKFCPTCQEQGLKSKVYFGHTMCTAVFCGNGYYNEEGYFVAPDRCNTCTTDYSCSQGHKWAESY